MTDTIVKTIFFAASREIVWSYLTDKNKLGEWFHPAENDFVEGEDYKLVGKGDDGQSIDIIWGKVLTMQAPSKLVYTFIIGPFEGKVTTLYWDLEEVAGGTRVTLKHEGVASASGQAALNVLQSLDTGWDEHFARLRAVEGLANS